MRYLSVCAGIEAASVAWHDLDWEAVAFSEIESFPCAVLRHHYPSVPNWGDMTKFKEWPDADVDVLVGGTPCQSFSVAGMRKGLDDPRGNLMLTYLAIAERYRPRWVVWENVPGVLSDKTGAFECLLDGLESLGYIVDTDVLDAQFHGVPQRRRRVFVCGQHRDDLLKRKTDSSALTIAQCLLEILHSILVVTQYPSGSERTNSDLAYLSRDGIQRRMRLFGLAEENDHWPILRDNLGAANQRYQTEQNVSGVALGGNEKAPMQGDPLMDSKTVIQSTLTDESWLNALDESYEVMRLFITSTATNPITIQQIYTCSIAVLHIAQLILRLNQSSPCFWNAASSALIALEEYIDFARQTSSDLFEGLDGLQAWFDFVSEAEPTNDAIADIGIDNFGTVLPISQSLCGNTPPSRKERKDVAPTIGSRSTAGGGLGTDFDLDGGLIADEQSLGDKALLAGNRKNDPELETFVTGTLAASGAGSSRPAGNANGTDMLVTHALTAEGFDASEDGTGRGTPLVAGTLKSCGGRSGTPNGAEEAEAQNGIGISEDGTAYTLDQTGSQAVCFAQNSRDEVREMPYAGALGAEPGAKQQSYAMQPEPVQVQWASGGGQMENPTAQALRAGAEHSYQFTRTGMTVRRLTPRECERLQGFPDDYTLIPYKGKPAADGPRYKALGNSMAVPVMRWIGERIAFVKSIPQERS